MRHRKCGVSSGSALFGKINTLLEMIEMIDYEKYDQALNNFALLYGCLWGGDTNIIIDTDKI